MKRRFLYFAITVIILSVCHESSAQKIVNLGSLDYPPYTGSRLKQGGLLTQIVREAYARVGYQVTVRYYRWTRATRMVKKGLLDGLVMAWMREDRKEWSLFSDPMPSSEIVFYTRKDRQIAFDGQNYPALKPYKIGIIEGYGNPEGFEQARNQLQVEAVSADIQNFVKLTRREIDLVLIDKFVGQYLLQTQMPDFADLLTWIDAPLATERNYLVISKKAAQAHEKLKNFNRGLSILEQEGRIQAILEEHGFEEKE